MNSKPTYPILYSDLLGSLNQYSMCPNWTPWLPLHTNSFLISVNGPAIYCCSRQKLGGYPWCFILLHLPIKKRLTKSCSSLYIIIILSTSFGHTATTLDPHLLNYWSLHFHFCSTSIQVLQCSQGFFLSSFNENLIATPLLETLSMVCHALCDIGPAHLSRLLSNHSDYSIWSCRSTCLLFISSIC